MARGISDALFKKNTKLESFLKRTLPEEAFDRVRAYESCIIVSEKENKAFKYCVLDDEYIYLTENPPKNAQDIQAVVSLKDIAAVDMVNDFPDFLSGEERDNTQHLKITHWTSANVKRRSFRTGKSKKSPRSGSVSDLHGDRSNASTPMDFTESSNLSDDYGYFTQSMSSLQISRPESRGSINSNQGLKSGGREIKTSSIGKKKKRMSESMEDSVLKSLKEELEDGQLEDIEEKDSVYGSSFISTGAKSNRKESQSSRKGDNSLKKGEDSISHTGNLGLASSSDLGGSINGLSTLSVDGSERRRVVLNIYLLNIHSPMLMLIRSAWKNYLIRCTLNIDGALKSNVIRSGQIQRERMEILFNQLKRELLNSENSLEDNFALLVELKNSTLKNFAIKKLFWKNSDMFLFMVRQLQRYLPKSPVNVNTEHGRVQRADELEMIVTLVEILIIMFRETEIIPYRMMTLKADRGKPLFDLLRVLVCSPEIPEKDAVPRGKGNKHCTDEEVQSLTAEFSRVAMMAVFEIFLMAQQANWSYSEGSYFNISWIIRTFEEMRTTEHFVEKVVTSMLKFVGPTQTEPLTPKEAILLYTQFSVLNVFLQYSPRMSAFIRSNYLEEFKYFVQVPIVMRKVPKSYPIVSITGTVIESVTSRVLSTTSYSTAGKSPR